MYDPTTDYEQLDRGVGAVQPAPDGSNTHQVRIVPIGENDVTVGQSGKRTRWSRDALKAAVDDGAFDGAKIVKGKGGEGHFALDEQVPPERLLGRVDSWEYESGVGPVGEAELLDEDLARQIDMGLLEVSADMIRYLNDDGSGGAYEVDEIVAVPRVTVLDRGASKSAEIELAGAPAGAAAVGSDDTGSVQTRPVEQLASALGVDGTTLAEYLQSAGDAVRWESSAGGDREPADYRYGVVVDDLQDGPDDSVLVAVYQPTPDYDGWEARNEQNPIQQDTLEVVGNDGVASLPPVSQVTNTEQNAPGEGGDDGGDGDADGDGTPTDDSDGADAPPEPPDTDVGGDDADADEPDDGALEALLKRIARYARGIVPSTGDPSLDEAIEGLGDAEAYTVPEADPRGGGDGVSTSDERAESRAEPETHNTSHMTPDPDPSPQEQLADARAKIRTLEADLDEREAKIEGLNEQIDEIEDEKEALADEKESLEGADDDLEALREQIKPWQETLADIAAGDSMLDAETIAETHSFEQLSDTVLTQLDEDGDDASPMDRLKEQLSSGVQTRGEPTETPPDDDVGEEQLAEADHLAETVMNLGDLRAAEREGLSPREYVRDVKGADPLEAESESELRRKIASGPEAPANGGD